LKISELEDLLGSKDDVIKQNKNEIELSKNQIKDFEQKLKLQV